MKKIKISGVRWGRVFSALAGIGLTMYFAVHLDNQIFKIDEPLHADPQREELQFVEQAVGEFDDEPTEVTEIKVFEHKIQYYQGAKVKHLDTDAVIKIVDSNKQESELQLEGITYLHSQHASAYIVELLAENTFFVEYSSKNKGQIYINGQSLTNLLIEQGYTN